MVSKAKLRFVRIAPRQIRGVADLIRGKTFLEAERILENLDKRAARVLMKLLNSALSNARRNPQIEPENLYVSRIYVDGGAMLKRFRAVPMGRAVMVRKRTAHINLELEAIRKIESTQAPAAKPAKRKKVKLAKRPKKAITRTKRRK